MGELEDRLQRLAEHRAAQIPAYSMPPTDELAVRRRRVPRPVITGIAACLAVALVIGGALLFAGGSNGPTVQTPGTLGPCFIGFAHVVTPPHPDRFAIRPLPASGERLVAGSTHFNRSGAAA